MHFAVQNAANYDIDEAKLAEFASNIEIPACPNVIVEMNRAQNQEFPDIRAIAELAAKDPAMAAALLKTVNSPYFGLRNKMVSVQQAAIFLGTRNVINIVTAIALKNIGADAHGEGPRGFWERTSMTAAFAADLANRIIGLARDEVYIHGLFRDAAIPLMIAYRVKSGQLDKSLLTNKTMYLAQVEVEQSSTDHAIIGSHFTRKWLLPDNTQQSVRLHLNIEMFLGTARKADVPKWVALQIALGYLGEHVMREHFRILHPAVWLDGQLDAFLKYVDIEREEFQQITREMLDEQHGKLMAVEMERRR